jgi:hypothetical protein
MKTLDLVGLAVVLGVGVWLMWAWSTGFFEKDAAGGSTGDAASGGAGAELTAMEKARMGLLTLADCPPGSTGIVTNADGSQSCMTPYAGLAPVVQQAVRGLRPKMAAV